MNPPRGQSLTLCQAPAGLLWLEVTVSELRGERGYCQNSQHSKTCRLGPWGGMWDDPDTSWGEDGALDESQEVVCSAWEVGAHP